jgi:large subunit ribosomal protein L3
MARGMVGKKVGMSQVFDRDGNMVPVTVLELAPNKILQVKTREGKDGYNAIKVGYEPVAPSKLTRPQLGVFHHRNAEPMRFVREFRVWDDGILADMDEGGEITVDMFQPGVYVDVTGRSKGRGFQGVMKRHGFKGAKESSHGTHEYKRHAGSIGCSAYPGRVIKGKKMAGQMGDVRVTNRALTVMAVYPDKNLMLVKGSVPGPKNGLVSVKVSTKQPKFL